MDAIIHEQIGDALFDERVVTSIANLRDRLLKADPSSWSWDWR